MVVGSGVKTPVDRYASVAAEAATHNDKSWNCNSGNRKLEMSDLKFEIARSGIEISDW
jgi:hypothetical protein